MVVISADLFLFLLLGPSDWLRRSLTGRVLLERLQVCLHTKLGSLRTGGRLRNREPFLSRLSMNPLQDTKPSLRVLVTYLTSFIDWVFTCPPALSRTK